jgi:hypothetical protein
MKKTVISAALLLLAISACGGKHPSAGPGTPTGSASPTAQAGSPVASPASQASDIAAPSAAPSAQATTPSAGSSAGSTGGLTGTWVAVTTSDLGGPQPGAFTVAISESGGDYKMTSVGVIPYQDLDGSSCNVPSGVEIAYFAQTSSAGAYPGRLGSWIPNSQGGCVAGPWSPWAFTTGTGGKLIMNDPDADGVVTTLTRNG